MNIELQELKSEYFDHDALRTPPVRLYRVQTGGVRLYYTYDLDDSIQFFPGVTGLLEKVLPTPEGLIKWKIQMGFAEANSYTTERMGYGSLMHSVFAQLLIKGEIDLDGLEKDVFAYFQSNGYQYSISGWVDELKKDVLAFVQWVQDTSLKPLAIEVPLCSHKYRVASMIDLMCTLEIDQKGFWGETYKSGPRKGQPKETKQRNQVYAIVDFKSGKNGCSGRDSHELQLSFCEQIVKENFPEFEQTDFLLFNWHPKDWQSGPSYQFINQTQKHSARELELLSELFHLRHNLPQKTRILTQGKVSLASDLTTNYSISTIADVVQEWRETV